MTAERTFSLTADPAWPWSLPGLGLPLLTTVAILLVALTLWTYSGVRAATPRRVTLILGLRLAALVVALLTVLRPTLAVRDNEKSPGVLLFLLDASGSMTVRDEVAGRTRWDELRRILASCEPALAQLNEEQNVSATMLAFAESLREFDPKAEADGKRSDYGSALAELYVRFGAEKNVRGVLLFGDGADNGTRLPTLGEAARWRAPAVPVNTFALGQTTTRPDLRDLAVASLNLESSVPVKNPVALRLTLDAPGFEGGRVRPKILFDDEEVPLYRDRKLTQPLDTVELLKATGNEETVYAQAPARPGEVKVTVRVPPLPGEATTANNETSTFVSVTKEGLSVLYVDKLRYFEPPAIADALRTDPRIRLTPLYLQTDEPGGDLFQFDKQVYDVVILGDVSARVLTAGRPRVLEEIGRLVREKGVGLMMIGGMDSFGGETGSDWRGTPVADLLPVELVPGSLPADVRFFMRPTPEGMRHFVMRLVPGPKENAEVWERKLPRLEGMNKLGRVKAGASVLARASGPGLDEPLLVGQQVGTGRVLAFGGDTTYLWRGYNALKGEGNALHARFWRQAVLWLAKQDEAEGSAYVRPDTRRLAAGGKQGFVTGLRGKTGVEVADARFEVKVVGPDGAEVPVPVAKSGEVQRGTFWKTDKPGEYRIVARGQGTDADGSAVTGEANARFLVYQDDTEMLRQAADHEFLAKVAAAGSGKGMRADDLPRFLQELKATPPPQQRSKVTYLPDWRGTGTSPFLPILLLLFVGLIGGEWALRRAWGLA
jgi:uncharacterized membrane protein